MLGVSIRYYSYLASSYLGSVMLVTVTQVRSVTVKIGHNVISQVRIVSHKSKVVTTPV